MQHLSLPPSHTTLFNYLCRLLAPYTIPLSYPPHAQASIPFLSTTPVWSTYLRPHFSTPPHHPTHPQFLSVSPFVHLVLIPICLRRSRIVLCVLATSVLHAPAREVRRLIISTVSYRVTSSLSTVFPFPPIRILHLQSRILIDSSHRCRSRVWLTIPVFRVYNIEEYRWVSLVNLDWSNRVNWI